MQPAEVSQELRELAGGLPEHVRLGTSSWSFPGWEGLVYDELYSQQRLAREGLAAYARHPLFRTVGVDRTHYAPVDADVFQRYAEAVADDFLFLAKAHEACTLARFPEHPRYGRSQGEKNPLFLDPDYASERVVAPFVSGLGAKAGPLLFQFAPQPMKWLGGPVQFARRLHHFFARLPAGPLYAVEIRNSALLSRELAHALLDVGVCPCINLLGGMPPPQVMWQRLAGHRAPALVVRWMLTRGLSYEQARNRYQPFNAIVDADATAVHDIARLVRENPDRPAYIIANNKAEGSAPISLARLAREILHGPDLDDVPF